MPAWIIAAAVPAALAQGLAAELADFAGRPVAVDQRLAIPPCPEQRSLAWRGAAGQAIEVRCPASGWVLTVPVPSAGRLPDHGIRRGDRVIVEAGGSGFAVRAEAVVEATPGGDGRIALRNPATGRRLTGQMMADGRVLVR